ncbi:MAG: NifX-associated nitrogen fixation protein, partial [Planctomycetota bacterium]
MTTTLVEPSAIAEAPFLKELVKQVRAIDTYDAYDDKSEADLIDPFIMTPERRREVPLVGEPDEIVMSRVKAYYNALASRIEAESGLMAAPVIKTTHEGFGRVFIIVGKLIAFDRSLRDLHRFGFKSTEKLVEKADGVIASALKTI